MEPRRTNRIYIWIAVIVIIIIAGALLYTQIFKTGTIMVYAPAGTAVYIDDAEQTTSTKTEPASFRVRTGTHTVLVSQDGSWPWAKTVTIKSREETAVRPFFVSHAANGAVITAADPEYGAILTLTSSVKVPAVATKAISPQKNVAVWVEDSTIFAERQNKSGSAPDYFCDVGGACADKTEVFASQEPIKNVAFYDGRDDVILVAVGKTIYAIEIDKKPYQNIQPLYQGIDPTFVLTNAGKLIIRDKQALMEVTL